ncbi:MAG TPA: hypothetical protein VF157_12765, partial [Chloroflexota bacterium]
HPPLRRARPGEGHLMSAPFVTLSVERRVPRGSRTVQGMLRSTLSMTLGALLLALAACGPVDVVTPSTSAAAATNGGGLPAASATVPPQPQASIAGKLAFTRGGNIWVFAGSMAKQVTQIGSAADPAWSPDGKQLAFDKQDKNSSDLYLMAYPDGQPKALTSNTSRVVENNFWDMQPDWSPDGLALAYVSDRGRSTSGTLDPAAWRLTLASGTRTQISRANQYAGGVDFPRWRPGHSSQLLYTSWSYDPQTLEPYGQLMLLDTRTSTAEALSPPRETAFQPSWSPDGDAIVFVKRSLRGDDLWLLSLKDSAAGAGPTVTPTPEPRHLLQGPGAHPVWSPDGRSVAYIGLKDGSFDLFVQPLNDALVVEGQPKQLTAGLHVEGASSIAWSK